MLVLVSVHLIPLHSWNIFTIPYQGAGLPPPIPSGILPPVATSSCEHVDLKFLKLSKRASVSIQPFSKYTLAHFGAWAFLRDYLSRFIRHHGHFVSLLFDITAILSVSYFHRNHLSEFPVIRILGGGGNLPFSIDKL